jgi:hypothetical protein
MGHDHLVDIAALGRDEGRQEAVLVFLRAPAIFSASPVSGGR